MYGKREPWRTQSGIHALGLIALSIAWLTHVERATAETVEQVSAMARCDRALEQLIAAKQHVSGLKDTMATGGFSLDLLLDSQRRQLEVQKVYNVGSRLTMAPAVNLADHRGSNQRPLPATHGAGVHLRELLATGVRR